MRGFWMALALTAALSGCLGDGETDTGEGSENEGVGAALAEPWVVDNSGTGCNEAFLLFPMDAAAVAEHLPDGYTPGDLQPLVGSPVATGSSGAYLTTFTCAESAYANDTLLSSDWGFVVEAPQVNGTNGSTPVNFYSMQVFTANAELVAAFDSAGVAGARIAPEVTVDTLPTGSSTGMATVEDDQGVLISYEVTAPAPSSFTSAARFWHSATNGTVVGEYHLDDAAMSQGGATCTIRSGSMLANALGFTSCTGQNVSALTLNGVAWHSEFLFVPGVWAE